jgi:hypothetical protein
MEQLNEQAMEALALANEVRTARTRDKKLIGLGRLEASSVLRTLPKHWTSARTVELLTALPRVGRKKAAHWLVMEQVSSHRRLRDLTERQRTRLAAHLDTYMDSRAKRMQVKARIGRP